MKSDEAFAALCKHLSDTGLQDLREAYAELLEAVDVELRVRSRKRMDTVFPPRAPGAQCEARDPDGFRCELAAAHEAQHRATVGPSHRWWPKVCMGCGKPWHPGERCV